MNWLKYLFKNWPGQKKSDEPVRNIVDLMKDDINPTEVTIENAYKTRWIWYHTMLAVEILMTNILLLAIIIILSIKL